MALTASSTLHKAGRWLLESGIQSENGGVARYYRKDLGQNLPVSCEITGYALSAFCYLFELTGEEAYRNAAGRAAHFLTEIAWDPASSTMPFELEGGRRYSYFFDCGIIARGLLWHWRLLREEKSLEVASSIGLSMERDFRSFSAFHPIIWLPCKSIEPYTTWWSRMPGAFQLKSALAWLDLAGETGREEFRGFYEEMLAFALRRYSETLDIETERPKLMDRLHPWAYFLEGLHPVHERSDVMPIWTGALERGQLLLEELESGFVRSDVCAQLLRIQLLQGKAASPAQLARLEAFQFDSGDRADNGGFGFGRRDGEMMPHTNPVSTVFALQALEMASLGAEGTLSGFDWRKLI